MRDQFGRTIDYMRISITDRCNLRCRYCMPNGVEFLDHSEILRYEEILQIAQAAVELGIVNFKVTGGEPLVRRDCVDFIRRLKELPGVETVTLTTNGVLLASLAQKLARAGVDWVNISLDTSDREEYAAITGFDALDKVLAGMDTCQEAGLPFKLNCVLLEGSQDRLIPLARFAQERPIDVRFIEMMPIGLGMGHSGIAWEEALALLRREWPDLRPAEERRGNGPARCYASRALRGRIGVIDAVSHKFCGQCNRVRLTSTGQLKPCLCYGDGTDLRVILRTCPEKLTDALRKAIFHKPQAHCFDQAGEITEQKVMSQIGG